jgi:very-short-patch-repair endonuclease
VYKKAVSRKKLKELKRRAKSERLVRFSKELNKNVPASEVWFRTKFKKEVFERLVGKTRDNDFHDLYNAVFGQCFIPDIMNEGYKYIIEVDGSIHDTLKQAYRDIKKDAHYKRRGYRCFRVKAYNEDSYNQFLTDFKQYLNEQHETRLSMLYKTIKTLPLEEDFTINQQKIARYNKLDVEILTILPEPIKITNANGVILRRKS